MGLLRTVVYVTAGFVAGFFYNKYRREEGDAAVEQRPIQEAPRVNRASEEEVIAVVQAPAAEKEPAKEAAVRNDLTKIKGIGPVFAKRFYEAGVKSFADLAALDPEKAREISGLKEWQKADPADWIAQAAELGQS